MDFAGLLKEYIDSGNQLELRSPLVLDDAQARMFLQMINDYAHNEREIAAFLDETVGASDSNVQS